MFIRLTVIVCLICSGCQSGLLPCPTIKTARIKKSKPLRPSLVSFSARAEEPENLHDKATKNIDGRSISTISVEEWDCPHPGEKKFMPRAIKDNIRRNMKKINSNSNSKTDSLRTK